MSLNAITLQNQNPTAKLDKSQIYKNNSNFGTPRFELKNDEFINSKNNSQEKVGFKEGFKLVGKGFVNKIKSMAGAIVKHPIKSALAIGATSLIIAGMPLIGITSATAASVLALGFAGYAIGKTALDVVETVKDNKEGRYDEVRQDLERIGGDGVDLALSLPFAPKAINQVSRFAKYGTGTVGLNTELLSNLKNCHKFSEVGLEFAKANTSISYEMLGNEMGLTVKPKLVFKDLKCSANGMFGGMYEPTTGELQFNSNILTGKGKIYAELGKIGDPEIILRHELEHFRQFSDIARTENIGIDGLSGALTEYYNELKKVSSVGECEKVGFSTNTIENMTTGDKSVFNREFYQKVVEEQGIIKQGTPEAEMSAKYAQGFLEKIHPKPENIAEFEKAIKGINTILPTITERIKLAKAQLELYKSNILEKEAYAAQDKFIASTIKGRPSIVNDAVMADAAASEYFSKNEEA